MTEPIEELLVRAQRRYPTMSHDDLVRLVSHVHRQAVKIAALERLVKELNEALHETLVERPRAERES